MTVVHIPVLNVSAVKQIRRKVVDVPEC